MGKVVRGRRSVDFRLGDAQRRVVVVKNRRIGGGRGGAQCLRGSCRVWRGHSLTAWCGFHYIGEGNEEATS